MPSVHLLDKAGATIVKPMFRWKLGLSWPPNASEINTKNQMYIANMKSLRLVPNATYIPLTWGWHRGNANFRFGVGGEANFRVFRYQHVGIGNARLWRWVSKPTPGPHTNGFMSQWNIGFSVTLVWL